jgi:hypothetical protein
MLWQYFWWVSECFDCFIFLLLRVVMAAKVQSLFTLEFVRRIAIRAKSKFII